MRSTLLLLALGLILTTQAAPVTHSLELPGPADKPRISFTENKGQVCDQDHKARPDVLFSGSSDGFVYHLRSNGISYQLQRIDSWKEIDDHKRNKTQKIIDQYSTYRLDLNWLHANPKALIKKEAAIEGYSNFYLQQCPNGVLEVKSYGQVTYQNLYKGINLKWYEKNGQLKYDYLVAAGADHRQVQLEIKGAENIYISYMGDLVMETPFGEIIEQAPLVIQEGKTLRSKWLLHENVVSYDIEHLNPALPFIIDPGVRTWGTYFGASGYENSWSCTTNTLGDIFITGETTSTGTVMATSGAYQTTFAGGNYDAYLAKFNTSGMLLWATYYGGTGFDQANGCAATIQGDVFMLGMTGSTLGISSAGAYQSSYGGNAQDAFLVKFDASGVRQWATYYGDAGNEWTYACSTNSLGDVFIVGSSNTATGTALASAGSHQPANAGGVADGFVAKFDASGSRQWGTYYGGSGYEEVYSVCTSTSGDIFIAGHTTSTVSTVMSTPGAYQTVFAGASYDAFLAKFDGNGVRLWATYYGGNGNDNGRACALDASGNIYLGGTTQTTAGGAIATAGAYQTTNGGGSGDAFLVKFSPAGARQWGTYFGSTSFEVISGCAAKSNGDVFISGSTNNTVTTLTTPGAWQVNPGGGGDIFLIGFNTNGACLWSTYYGGSNDDEGYNMTVDPQDNIIVTGSSQGATGTVVVSAGAYQTAYGGGVYDALLLKFEDCASPPAPVAGPSQTLCAGNPVTVTASTSTGSIQWFASASYTAPALGTGTAYVASSLSAGVQTLYAGAFTCGASIARAAVVVTVAPNSTITVNSGTICAGQSFTIVASGAGTYTYSGGSNVVTPATSTSYSVTGTSSLGCPGSNTAVSSVTVRPRPTITANNGTVCSGNSFSIVASGASTYTYSSGSASVLPIVTTTYAVTGSSAGCVGINTAVVTVSVLPLPTLTAFGSNTFLCVGNTETVTLNANGASNYTWVPGGTGSSIAVSPSVTTTYTLRGADALGCKNSASLTVVVDPCTDLPALTVSKLLVYPNPFQNRLSIEGCKGCIIQVFDELGRSVHRQELIQEAALIDMSELSPGIYFLQADKDHFRLVKN